MSTATAKRSSPTTAKSPSMTPRTSPGSHGPAIVIARRAATVTAPWRAWRAVRGHVQDVLVEGAAGLVHGDRGQALDLRDARDDRDADLSAPRRCGRRSRRPGPSRGRWAARRPRRRRSRSIASSSMPVQGRRPGPPGTTTAPASLEQLRSPSPAATATIRRPARGRRAAPGRPVDLLGEVGDPDPVRAAGDDPGLDRGTDVVDVDVDVPQALAADHDERVAERGQRLLAGRGCGRRRRRGGTSPRTPARPRVRSLVRRPAPGCGASPRRVAAGPGGGR